MNSQIQNGKASPSKSKSRGCLIWLGASLSTLVGLALVHLGINKYLVKRSRLYLDKSI